MSSYTPTHFRSSFAVMSLVCLLFLLVLVPPSFATGSISISGVSLASSVTQGSGFTVTVSVSGSDATSVTGSLTLPSGLSCTPTGSQDISLSSGTGSASWSCTADVAGDYTNQITASVSATDSGTGGSLSDSEQTGLTVLAPASLAASSSIIVASVPTTGSTTFTVSIHNTGGESTTYSISMASSPSGVTATLASGSSSGTVAGGSVATTDYTVSASTANTYTITATVTGGNSQTVTSSQTLTVTAPPAAESNTTTTSTGSSGGPTGNSTSTSTTKTAKITIASATPTASKIIDAGLKGNETSIQRLEFTVSQAVSNVQITIDKLSTRPSSTSSAPPSSLVFTYLTFTLVNLSDTQVTSASIDFNVTRSWLTANSGDKSTVRLYRYTSGAWVELSTVLLQESATELLYRATSPGFSVFAVGAGPLPSTTAPNQTLPPTTTPPPTSSPSDSQPAATTDNTTSPIPEQLIAGSADAIVMIMLIAIVVAAAAGIGAFYFLKIHKKSGGTDYRPVKKEPKLDSKALAAKRKELRTAYYDDQLNLLQKIIDAFRAPGTLFNGVKREPLKPALVFLVLTVVVHVALSMGLPLALGTSAVSSPVSSLGLAGFGSIAIVMGLIALIVLTFVFTAWDHIFVYAIGGGREGFVATFKAIAYGSAPFFLISWIGMFLGSLSSVLILITAVWSLVLTIKGISVLHGIAIGRAAVSLVVPMVIIGAAMGALMFLATGVAGNALGAVSNAPYTAPTTFSTYQNPTYGFQVSYPQDAIPEEKTEPSATGQQFTVTFKDNSPAVYMVMVKDVPEGTTVDDVIGGMMSGSTITTPVGPANIVQEENITIAGFPARRMELSLSLLGADMRVLTITSVKGTHAYGTLYLLGAQKFAENRLVVDAIVSSFTFA